MTKVRVSAVEQEDSKILCAIGHLGILRRSGRASDDGSLDGDAHGQILAPRRGPNT
jgi:hypothetical protein